MSNNEYIYNNKTYSDISVVLITAYSEVQLAVKALKQGATDFVPKPWDNSKLLATVKAAIQLNFSKREVGQLKQKEQGLKQELNRDHKHIIGSSPQLMKVMSVVGKVAKTKKLLKHIFLVLPVQLELPEVSERIIE